MIILNAETPAETTFFFPEKFFHSLRRELGCRHADVVCCWLISRLVSIRWIQSDGGIQVVCAVANAVLDLFEAHCGERPPDSLSESACGCRQHPLQLDLLEVALGDAPQVLDAVELGVVWHVPHDGEVQRLRMSHRRLRPVDRSVVQHQRPRARTNRLSEVGEEVPETLCIKALRSHMP